MSSSAFPPKIDRFIIQEVLGRGAQAVVYLAQDPDLDRPVAIKSVLPRGGFKHQDIDSLMQEARTVSQLQHPNIVSIYDVGRLELKPYLVLEYIDGQTLHARLRSGIAMDRAHRIMRDVLSGVSAAHERGIIHRDLKPANIMLTGDDQAKVADFGLATLVENAQVGSDELTGTPQYMAPEYIETRQRQTVSDVFSLGLIFYEVLTGQRAVDGDDVYQLLNAIANLPIDPPSSINPEIDERLDAIIMKALARNPVDRYQAAGEMLKAFSDTIALGEAISQRDTSDSTVKFLLRRMKHKKDFPAFSQTITVLNKASTSKTESLASVSNAILKDISLTNKILRIVNSAYYSRGGKISTISRAVVMLGINPIKSLAASLMLFEHLQNKSQAHQLKEDAVTSLFSARLANDLALKNRINQHEEAFLCALLQQLGKLLVRFYLHEESLAIDQQVQRNGVEENTAALQVLGTTYHKLGMSVAREWGFPDQIVNSMQPIDHESLIDAGTHNPLHLIANFSNALSQALKQPLHQQAQALKKLTRRYKKALNLDEKQVSALIETSHKELKQFAKLIRFDISKSAFYQRLSTSADKPVPTPREQQQAEFGAEDSVKVLAQDSEPADSESSEKALTDGIQDITNTLTGDYMINEVMQMVLETIYRALPGSRVLLGLRNQATNAIDGKFGYGEDIEQLIANFAIPLVYQPDVFHIAFKNNVDIKIDNAEDQKIMDKIPQWYRRKIGSRFFLLFPIVIKHSPVAIIYIDSCDATTLAINDHQLSLLKTLRNQAVLAIKNLG